MWWVGCGGDRDFENGVEDRGIGSRKIFQKHRGSLEQYCAAVVK